MKTILVLMTVVTTFSVALSDHAAPVTSSAKSIVHQALSAQGGEEKLRAIETVQWQGVGYRNELEESERPEGPYITDFITLSEVDDYAKIRYRNRTETSVYPLYQGISTVVMSDGLAMQAGTGAFTAATPQIVQVIRERMALNPERLLLTAADAQDLRREPDVILQAVPQNVLAFTLDDAPVRIYLNAYTHLPTAMDYSGPLAHSSYYAFLGDITVRTYYGLWWLAKGGIHLPLQRTVEGDGMPDRTIVVRKLEINASLSEADLSIPQDIRAKYRPDAKPLDLEKLPLGNPQQVASELAPGIVFIPGSWNTTLIRQNDGVVVLEAPISSGYSAQVIAEVHRRFPGLPIKALVTTSDSWPHIAGIREFVADGIPIYALDLNRPILERLIAAPRTSKPDLLSRSPRKPIFHLVSEKVMLGTGANRIEIIPIRGETSERQMMVWFPEQRLLYGSDPFQRRADGSYFYPQTVSELVDAVRHNNLDPVQFFMMHIGLTPWQDLQKAISAAEGVNSPNGVL
jgi:hypothetical protein